MKNLTRVLALVLVLAMTMSTVAFASFTDVAAGDDNAEAIEMLAAIGILKGYEDGSFGADKAITRAEAVAIVNRIQGLQAAAVGSAGASLYTDVAADHWALGDINLATQMGIVSGDGDGNFRPEAQVSYQEMVKMLCCALGYQPAAADLGGWPTGYLVIANDKGILEDTVNTGAAPANRGVVAQLTYNALTAPLMAQTGYGSDKKYEFKDEEGKTETLLSSKLKIFKMEATPVANDVTAVEGTKAEVGFVKFAAVADDDFFGVKKPSDFKTTMLAGDSNVGDKLGYAAIVYFQKNTAEKEWEVLYSSVDEADTEVIEVAVKDIDSVVDAAEDYIYVVNEDNKVEEEYYFDASTTVIVNGAVSSDPITIATFEYEAGVKIEGTVEFVYADDDDFIDYIFVNKYITDKVDEESANGKTIILETNGVIDLDKEENDELVYTLKLDGKDVTPADLKEGDIVTYINQGTDYYEIIVTRDVVEGEIESTYVEDGVMYYTIAGKDYAESVSALAGGLTTKMTSTIGSAGAFYLDAFGKIAYYDRSAAVVADRNYGYIVARGDASSSSLNKKYAVEILTTEGTIETITLASKINLTVNKMIAGEAAIDPAYDAKSVKVYEGTTLDTDITTHLTIGKLVDYTVNSDGLLKSVTVWEGAPDTTLNEVYFAINGANAAAEYSARNSKLGNFFVTEDTVVFAVYGSDSDEYTVTDISVLEDEKDYDVVFVDANEDKEVAAIILNSELTAAAERENIAVFVKVATVKNAEAVTVNKVSFYKDGDLKELLTEDSSAVSLTVGDPFKYTVNAEGDIKSIEAITAGSYAYPADIDGINYVYGQVYDKSGDALKVGSLTAEEWDTHKIPAEANIYIVDNSGSKVTVKVGALADITKNRYTKAGVLFDEEDAPNFKVLIKYNEGVVTDVVAYKNFM